MGEEEQWNALCLNCNEENMRYIMGVPPDGYLYQCPSCNIVQRVDFSHGDKSVAKMEKLGVKIVYTG